MLDFRGSNDDKYDRESVQILWLEDPAAASQRIGRCRHCRSATKLLFEDFREAFTDRFMVWVSELHTALVDPQADDA